LIDDPDKTVVEPFAKLKGTFDKAYDFDLMQGGGHVSGYFIPPKYHAGVESALEALISPEALDRKYHDSTLAPLLFAVGDGNHSLATAKACYEELKAKIGEKALDHPARYALCEVVNLHDKAMTFEPIYRVVFDTDEKILDDLEAYLSGLDGQAPAQTIRALWQGKERVLLAKKPEKQLPVGTLQAFLDLWLKDHPQSHIDYIHNEDSVRKLVCGPGRIGFLFDGMEKSQLFDSVMRDGVLPRKTFSMGHAQDKRYCLDCRVIVKE
ncbi:MAG: DUF1015 family protein, partial [Clostridia bacterium]|nr:DUF1015 family protein [Clostridia bacterium]